MHEHWGYRGFLAELMERLELKPGDIVRVRKRGLVVEGMLMPRELLYGDKPILVIRLSNGYKVGIKIDESTCIEKIGTRAFGERSIVEREQKAELPKVALLSTGGTILSKIDYETGAVKPSLNVGELLEWAPELAEVSFIEVREVLRIFSEDMTPALWIKIAEEVYKVLSSGYKGVVIAHGTDTMSYTAAALAFAIRNKPSPIILTGSQRSSDRPSTDSAFNLHAAFIVAVKAPFAESVIVMHGETGDVYALVHRGVKARKMHTSRRDAFQSINDKPIAIVYPARNELRIVGRIYEERSESKEPILENHFDDKVALVKTYPGFSSE
ncbi:MAG: Glu-tRNA(Gln) amidotransferase subunit GatD, partial [Desulfurococcaceae archaeon]